MQDPSDYRWGPHAMPLQGGMPTSSRCLSTPISTPFSAGARSLGTIVYRFSDSRVLPLKGTHVNVGRWKEDGSHSSLFRLHFGLHAPHQSPALGLQSPQQWFPKVP